MLTPIKHCNPDRTIIAVATQILNELQKSRIVKYASLRTLINNISLGKSKIERKNPDPLFIPALDLLFILGLVEYHSNIDSFEYTGNQRYKP